MHYARMLLTILGITAVASARDSSSTVPSAVSTALSIQIPPSTVLASTSASPTSTSPQGGSTFGNKLIFQPDARHSVIYPRLVELSDGTILATVSYGGDLKPFFPIFASTDNGTTWTWRSNLTDQVNGFGLAAQPALAELPWDIGNLTAGTVLASGNSWGPDSTIIDLYASSDKGFTWQFISNVARGSAPGTQNGNPCIWEPFILPYNGTVGVFYSDQRDPLHGQKLAHQESQNLTSWGPVVNDVAYLNYTDRPGMTVITYVPPMNMWIFVHEFPGGDNLWSGVGYPVYYHLAKNPFEFQYGAGGYPISVNGAQPNASPYVVWSPIGGPNGTIIVSDADHSSVFTNTWLGAPDKWEIHATPEPSAYSRAMLVLKENPDHLMILGAGSYGVATSNFTGSVVSVTELLTQPGGGPGVSSGFLG